jgi:exonuclease III
MEKLDAEGRVVYVAFDKFTLFGVYVPNSGEKDTLQTLPKRLKFDKALQQLVPTISTKHKN